MIIRRQDSLLQQKQLDLTSFLESQNPDVVAHGAVRWWARPNAGKYEYYEYRAGCDESYALNIRASDKLLSMSPEEFARSSAQLATLHFSAAQQLMPRLQPVRKGEATSYTFVTGDGSGKPLESRGERSLKKVNAEVQRRAMNERRHEYTNRILRAKKSQLVWK
jgi:hypothetical protein